MKKSLFILILLLTLLVDISAEPVWEYLVIAKVDDEIKFTDPKELPFGTYKGMSALSQLNYLEANGLQLTLDQLGKQSWELIDVVGNIGGDQEFVFKRIYNQERSQQEYTESEIFKAIYLERIENETEEIFNTYPSPSKAPFINKDEEESKRLEKEQLILEQEENNKKVERYLEIANKSIGLKFEILGIEIDDKCTISIDGTNVFLNESNQYSLIEIESVVNNQLDSFAKLIPYEDLVKQYNMNVYFIKDGKRYFMHMVYYFSKRYGR